MTTAGYGLSYGQVRGHIFGLPGTGRYRREGCSSPPSDTNSLPIFWVDAGPADEVQDASGLLISLSA